MACAGMGAAKPRSACVTTPGAALGSSTTM